MVPPGPHRQTTVYFHIIADLQGHRLVDQLFLQLLPLSYIILQSGQWLTRFYSMALLFNFDAVILEHYTSLKSP